MSKDASASRPEGRLYVSLRGRSEFERVFREGHRRQSGGIVIIVTPGPPGRPRVGLVAAVLWWVSAGRLRPTVEPHASDDVAEGRAPAREEVVGGGMAATPGVEGGR